MKQASKLITKGTTPKNLLPTGAVNFIKVENINPVSRNITIQQYITMDENKHYLKRSQLESNDILFSIAGTLGRVAVIKDDILPANTNQALAIIRQKKFNLNFLETYLTGRSISTFVRRNPTVGAQPNLSLQQVGDFIINYPSSKEQTKTGKLFLDIDNLLAANQRQPKHVVFIWILDSS